MEKPRLLEFIQASKKSLWVRPDYILYFEKIRTASHNEIAIYFRNGQHCMILDEDNNRKKLQASFNLI
jgi:hypothetical protein